MVADKSVNITIGREVIATTLKHFREAARHGTECVVLWLAQRPKRERHAIVEVYRPAQIAADDYFVIPGESMTSILDHLDGNDLFIAAQVHTHPKRAFHSPADDEWAIIRHVGAISVVLPYFAARTTADTFLVDSAIFELDQAGKWRDVTREGKVIQT